MAAGKGEADFIRMHCEWSKQHSFLTGWFPSWVMELTSQNDSCKGLPETVYSPRPPKYINANVSHSKAVILLHSFFENLQVKICSCASLPNYLYNLFASSISLTSLGASLTLAESCSIKVTDMKVDALRDSLSLQALGPFLPCNAFEQISLLTMCPAYMPHAWTEGSRHKWLGTHHDSAWAQRARRPVLALEEHPCACKITTQTR